MKMMNFVLKVIHFVSQNDDSARGLDRYNGILWVHAGATAAAGEGK